MFNKSLVCLVIGCCAGVSDRRQSCASNLALGLDLESAGLRVVGRSLGERGIDDVNSTELEREQEA